MTYQGLRILVDTSPDLRAQLLRENITQVDAVVFTHCHADHIHGVDELRPLYYRDKKVIPVYGDEATIADLKKRFGYLMPSDPYAPYPKIIEPTLIEKNFDIRGINIGTFPQAHGSGKSRGFRFGGFAYTTDVSKFPAEALPFLENLDLWIIDCLTARSHPSHMHLKGALEWIERMKPKQAILIHMNHTLDYEELKAQLPKGVEPAFDGMRLEF